MDLALCFLRAPGGSFTTFDPPGSLSTYAVAINTAGTITGFYGIQDNIGNYIGRGFLRARDGTFATFDFPGTTSTAPQAINPAGAITGYYGDAKGKTHGFLRIPAHRDDDTEGDNTEGGND
jgi:hypothetical protein